MIVDREIKELVKKNNLIENFNEENLSSISYDISIDKFVVDKEESDLENLVLSSSSFVYIKAVESLHMPSDLCCMVIEKNSLMRMGLKVDGPLYQPGHNSSIYIRVMNISKKDILLKRNMRIAQLVFMKLDKVPDITYAMQKDARYNDEDSFRI